MSKFKPSLYIIAGLLNRLAKYYMSRSFYSKLSLNFLAAALASSATPILTILLNAGLKYFDPQNPSITCTNSSIEVMSLIFFFTFTSLCVFFALKANSQKIKNANKEAIIDDKKTGDSFEVGLSTVQFHCGNVTHISGIDVVVTSEDTDLNLGSISGASVSGRVRKMAATFNKAGDLTKDNLKTFIEQWKESENKLGDFRLGTTVECNNTYNAAHKDIKTIIFAVAIRKNGNNTSSIEEAAIDLIISSSIDIAIKNSQDSIYFPVFGLGRGGIAQNIAIPATVNAIRRKLTSLQKPMKVYIGVHTFDDLSELSLQLSAI
ncbi:hypothetical protein LOY54_22940 [Pseudomonas sp. B21-032]|uniref:hypothetical protein n=1 Tax=Pseudomonas sp. B21-032 TaxID=2895483 RepID=UPI00216014E9|nr:hypothetical protein [Pseudomonas sp. B21-032]UVL60847.1 hypothetical protein LOY54_22940 [Pseudomonas sp. B21-032]